ncbi:MAG TPA: hypothetical protein V6C78_27985 [Crinalium sp.]
MKIVWERSIYIGNAPVFCTICGHRYHPLQGKSHQLLLAILYDERGVACGEVCRHCVASGSAGIKARLSDRIQSLQTKLDELQDLAKDDIETPSLEEEFQIHQREGG